MRPPWWYWLQVRDILPVVVSILVLVGFLSAVALGGAWLIVTVMSHIRDAWNSPG